MFLRVKCPNKNPNKSLITLFNNIDNDLDKNVLEKSRRIIGEEQGCSSCSTEEIDPYQPINDTSVTDLTISKVIPAKVIESCIVRKTITNDDIVVKKEVVSLITKKPLKNVKYFPEEDKQLELGIRNYGRKAWL